jgi:hypothetical protein
MCKEPSSGKSHHPISKLERTFRSFHISSKCTHPAAPIRHSRSTRDAVEARDISRKRCLRQRHCTIAPAGGNLSHLHSRARWHGQDVSSSRRCRIACYQGTVSQWKLRLGTFYFACIEATSATLFLEILYIQLQVPGDNQVTLEKIISELDASKTPRLILLDNFETPWNAPGRTQK